MSRLLECIVSSALQEVGAHAEQHGIEAHAVLLVVDAETGAVAMSGIAARQGADLAKAMIAVFDRMVELHPDWAELLVRRVARASTALH